MTEAEIPEDVMKASRAAIATAFAPANAGGYLHGVRDRERIIARALLAERAAQRERDAAMIEEGVERGRAKQRRPGVPSKNDECPHGRYMYEDCEPCCAAAIRNGSTA